MKIAKCKLKNAELDADFHAPPSLREGRPTGRGGRICVLFAAALAMLFVVCQHADAYTSLRNICRVKGQEENVLRGLGMVVGLNGTGEAGDAATMRALAAAMEIMGSPVPEAILSTNGKNELEKIKSVALVMVTAYVPATGARRGDKLDCHVMGISGKSLAGGRLAFAALQGPNTKDKHVYALCEGEIRLDDPEQPMVGRIHEGCQMEQDVFTPFVKDNRVTLVLEKNHANFYTASAIGEQVQTRFWQEDESRVRVINAANIVIEVPPEYETNKVGFVADVLDERVYFPEPEARVVINGRTGSIVVSGDVTIGDVVVSHKDVVVETARQGPRNSYRKIDLDDSEAPRLDSLVTALDSLKVPNQDIIEIIKGIERNGKLHARLIIE